MVNPEKRYTAMQALEHPWIAGNAAPQSVIPGVVDKLIEYNAKRTLKVSDNGKVHVRREFSA